MQIEDIAGVRFASGRTVQQQGDLTVRYGVLGEIVVHDQHVAALVHEILAHRRAGKRRDVLKRRGIGRRGAYDRRILHRTGGLQPRGDLRNGGALLADGNIDAEHILPLLGENGVDSDGGFAGLTVADDELTLAAADGHERVDRLDAGVQRHGDRLPVGNGGRLKFDGPGLGAPDAAPAVDGLAESVHNAAEHRLADGHACHLVQTAHAAVAVHMVVAAKDDAADAVGLDIHDHAALAVDELDQLAVHDVGETVHPADAVRHAEHAADLEHVDAELHMAHGVEHAGADGIRVRFRERPVVERFAETVELVGDGVIVDRIADAELQPADQLFLLPHPVGDLPTGGGDERFGTLAHLLDGLVGKHGGGGERHIQHALAGDVGNIAGRQMDLREDLLDCRVLAGKLGSLIFRRAHVLLGEREDLLNDLRAGREEHFAALVGGIRLILRIELCKSGLSVLFRRGQLGLERRVVRYGHLRQRLGSERRFRFVQLTRDLLPAGTENLHDGFPPDEINEPRKDQKIDNGIYKTHNHFVLFVVAFVCSPAVRCSMSAYGAAIVSASTAEWRSSCQCCRWFTRSSARSESCGSSSRVMRSDSSASAARFSASRCAASARFCVVSRRSSSCACSSAFAPD